MFWTVNVNLGPITSISYLRNAAATCLLVFSLSACSSSDVTEREPEHYILPASCVGAFYVVFEQSQGEELVYKDGARQYEIPENGILLSQGLPNEGVVPADDIRFFCKTEQGPLIEVTERWTTSIGDPDAARQDPTVYIFGGGPGVFSSSREPCKVRFRGFHVGTKAQILDLEGHFDITDFLKTQSGLCD